MKDNFFDFKAYAGALSVKFENINEVSNFIDNFSFYSNIQFSKELEFKSNYWNYKDCLFISRENKLWKVEFDIEIIDDYIFKIDNLPEDLDEKYMKIVLIMS